MRAIRQGPRPSHSTAITQPAEAPVRILYIAGYSRSGSTLLLRLLGEIEGVLAVGELFDVWRRSYQQNQLCGCGEKFGNCPFWSAVTERAFHATPEQLDTSVLQRQRQRVQGYRTFPQHLIRLLRSGRFHNQLAAYTSHLHDLYAAISQESGARIVVDSSKVPQYAWVLNEVPTFEVHVCHLVRDSRAAAFSWQRRRVRPEIHWKLEHMDRHSLTRSAFEWCTFNLLLDVTANRFASYTLVRYEDLVRQPAVELSRIGSALHEEWSHLTFNETVSLGVSHTASGNPARFQVGATGISSDSEWERAMPRRAQLAVTAMTAPLLARYGYRLSGASESD